MIRNKYIQSAFAKAIGDARFLDYLEKDRLAGRILGKSKALNAAVHTFSAFICKAQYDFLEKEYPLTFFVLGQFRLTGAIFSRYLSVHQKLKKKNATDEEKESAFIFILENQLKRHSSITYSLALDTLKHEATVKRIEQRERNGDPEYAWKTKSIRFCVDLPITAQGNFELVELHCDPDEITRMARTKKIPSYQSQPATYCYLLEKDCSKVTLFEMDPTLVLAMSRIDGKNSVNTIAATLMSFIKFQ